MSWIERDLDRNPLNNLGEVTGGIVGRQQCELGAARWSNLDHLSMQHDSWKSIDLNIGHVALSDIGELGLFEVRLNPDVALDEVDYLHARSDQLTCLHM